MATSPTKVELLVYGYIRTEIESNKSWTLIIPDPIKAVCKKYHGFVFTESNILNAAQQLDLWNLLSQKINFQQTTLLYNALRDGFTEDAFYKNTESKSPTVIIAHTNYGNICGAFTTVHWKKGATKSFDYHAFIWLLKSNKDENIKPQIFNSSVEQKEVFQSGQVTSATICFFGCPAAFSVAEGCNTIENNYAYRNRDYGIHDGSVLCGGKKANCQFGCVDVEMFQIKPPYKFQYD